MNRKYYYEIFVSAQINRYNFLVVYEPYRALEGLQCVGFQGKTMGKTCSIKNGLKLLRKVVQNSLSVVVSLLANDMWHYCEPIGDIW